MGGSLRAEGAFCCLQPGLELLEELQVGLSFLGRMSLVCRCYEVGFVCMDPGDCPRTDILW